MNEISRKCVDQADTPKMKLQRQLIYSHKSSAPRFGLPPSHTPQCATRAISMYSVQLMKSNEYVNAAFGQAALHPAEFVRNLFIYA